MSGQVQCPAWRRGRGWVAHDTEHGVYGHGRTLHLAGASLAEGLALLGVGAAVVLVPQSPELDALRRAEQEREAALHAAVAALVLRRASARDIAAATGASPRRVQRILAELAHGAHRAGCEATRNCHPVTCVNDKRVTDLATRRVPANGVRHPARDRRNDTACHSRPTRCVHAARIHRTDLPLHAAMQKRARANPDTGHPSIGQPPGHK